MRPRAREWSTACRRSKCSSRARARAARRRSARCRQRAWRFSVSRTSRRRHTTASARRSGGVFSGSRSFPEVQAVPPGGHEALPQGRALPDREVRDRAALLSAGRARPRPDQAERVPPAAAREAEGAPLLRPVGDAVPHLLREGEQAGWHHGRQAAAHARDASRQRRLSPRLRRVTCAGAPARAARSLLRERPPRQHPQLPGQARRRRRPEDRIGRGADRPGRDRPHRRRRPMAAGGPRRSHRDRSQVAGACRDRHAGLRAAHRRAVFQVTVRSKSRFVERTTVAVRATDFQVPKITHEEVNENRGVFVIEPLDRGFGYTFGNSLRRVLLSSLEGAAVTSVKIEGVAHEFTTLPGVREDVTDIILNLKQLVCILHGESPEVEVRLTKRGEGIVTASDIEAPADLEILNPDLEVANLSSKGRLEIALTIGRGRGYLPAEGNRGQAHTIGVIPVDSMFSPINRVAYDVEAGRGGQRTDYDKLILDVTTTGSIEPKEAIGQAAEILIRQLAIFTDLEKIEGFGENAATNGDGAGESAGVSLAGGMENFPIEELELGVRSYNCLKRVGIETIGDLVTKSENELAAIPNFGKKSIEEVKETLAQHGLGLRGSSGAEG